MTTSSFLLQPIKHVWHNVGHSLCGCRRVPIRGSLYLFWCETHTKGLRARSTTRRGKECPRGEQGSQRIGQSTKDGGSRLLACVDPEAGSANVKRCQCSWWSYGIFARIHARDSSQNAWKVSQTSPFLRLELTQVRVCSLFFHPLGCLCCVLCVRKEMWKTPGGDERNH